MNVAQAKTMDAQDQAAIAGYLAKGEPVTVITPNVSRGMKKTDYIARQPGGFANGPRAEAIKTDDPKFDMYCNALPKELRSWAAGTGQDVRGMYKEYRVLKRDGLVAKYLPVVAEWERGNENGEHC